MGAHRTRIARNAWMLEKAQTGIGIVRQILKSCLWCNYAAGPARLFPFPPFPPIAHLCPQTNLCAPTHHPTPSGSIQTQQCRDPVVARALARPSAAGCVRRSAHTGGHDGGRRHGLGGQQQGTGQAWAGGQQQGTGQAWAKTLYFCKRFPHPWRCRPKQPPA